MANILIRRLLFSLLLFAGIPLFAQTSAVTATLTDADAVTWTLGSCTVSAVYTPQNPAVAPYLNGGGNVPLNPPCTVNGSGVLSVTVTDVAYIAPRFNLTWQFVVCPNISQQAGTSACGTTQIAITGASPNITGQLNLPVPRIGGGIGAFAYADVEVKALYNNFYWNIVNSQCRTYTTAWANCGGGGGGGSGTVNAGTAWQLTYYPTPGGTVVGPAPNLWMLIPTATAAQVNTFLAGLTAGSDVVLIPPSFPQMAFTNTNYVEMIDMRPNAMTVQVGSAGVSCDAYTAGSITMTSGVNSVNVGSYPGVHVGGYMSVAYRSGLGYGATQETWLGKIATYSPPIATFVTPPPFSYSGFVTFGTDNTAALQQIFNNAGATFPLWLPTGCRIFVANPVAWNNNQSILGQQMGQGGFLSGPGKDILQQPDGSGLGNVSGNGVRVENVGFVMDSPVDPTFPITDYDLNGNATTRAPLYRPLHMAPEAQDANDPCAPGWATNCSLGVATVTAASAVICTSNTYAPPPVGETVVFPYLSTLFSATVSSTAGSCASGFTARTLSAAMPAGSTGAQVSWFAGTAFQSITTTIPANPTLPLTVNLTLPTQPVPGYESNFASHGHIKIGSSECDYMGNGGYGTQLVLRRCNTIPGYSGTNIIVPLNPCPAKNAFAGTDMPWPVTPTINTGDSTPSGANYYPGLCGGPAALSFPQANGNVWAGGGLGKAFLENLQFDVSQATPQELNGTTAYYSAGNTGSYGADFGGWAVDYLQYGIVQGPASSGQHGVAAAGPTGDANKYHDIAIHAGYPLTWDDLQNSHIDRIDTYGSETSPYDGTIVGAGTCLFIGYTLDEQTGLPVTTTSYDAVTAWECEPERGSTAEVPVYAQIDEAYGVFTADNFEGAFTIIGGLGNTFISSNIQPPAIDYGLSNHFQEVPGLSTQYITNVWSNGFMEWGTSSDCSYVQGGVFGPSFPCAPGLIQPVSGRSIDASITLSRYENPQSGIISSGEWNTNATYDPHPMAANNVIDSTELFTGRYASCNLGGANQCGIAHFDGFTGQVVISPNGRLSDTSYDIVADFKSATAAGQFTLSIGVEDPGTGTCSGGSAVLATYVISTTTSWVTWESPTPVSFAGKDGCSMTVTYGSATTTDQYRVGKFDYINVPGQVIIPTATPTVGAACTGPNAVVGANSSGLLLCIGSIVVQGSGGGGGISLTTTGTSGAATLSGTVLNIPVYSGGSSGFPITLGGTSIGAGSSNSTLTSLTLTSSSINGVTPSSTGSNTLFLNQAGGYTTPAGSGTQTICSGTISLGTSAIASGAAASTVTATCTGLLSTDNIMLDFNGSPLGVVGYQPSTNGTLTIIKWPTSNTLNVAVVNNTQASVTPGAITLNFRAVR